MKNEQSRIDTIEVSKGEYQVRIIFSHKNHFGKEVITEEYWCGEYLSSKMNNKGHFYTVSAKRSRYSGYTSSSNRERLEAFAKTEVDRIIDERNYPRLVNSVVYP